MALMHKEHVQADLFICRSGGAGRGFVAVLHGEGFTVPPSGAFRNQPLCELRGHELVAAARVEQDHCQLSAQGAELVGDLSGGLARQSLLPFLVGFATAAMQVLVLLPPWIGRSVLLLLLLLRW